MRLLLRKIQYETWDLLTNPSNSLNN